MVLAASGRLQGKGEDHVRPHHAHHAHDVAQRLLAPPLLEGLLHAERIAELVRAREVLRRPVVAMDRGQLLRAQDAEGLEQLRPDLVLSAVAPGDRQERRVQPAAAVELDEHAVVLVVGMGRHIKDGPGSRQVAKGQRKTVRAFILRDGAELGPYGRREVGGGQDHGERETAEQGNPPR